MLRIIQVIHTFIVDAEDLREAQSLIADSIKVDPQPNVTVAQRQIKASDPFMLDEDMAGVTAKRA